MNYEKYQFYCQIGIAACVILGALFTFGNSHFLKKNNDQKEERKMRNEEEREKKKAYFGILKPKNTIEASDNFNLKLGGVIFTINKQKLPFNSKIQILKETPFPFDYPLFITFQPEGISIDAEFFNLKGELQAKISQNEWMVNPNNTWKRNYNKNSLEILNDRLKSVLRVSYLNQNTLDIGGVLFLGKAYFVIYGENSGASLRWYPNEQIIEHAYTRMENMFIYPSDLHLGELNPKYGEKVYTQDEVFQDFKYEEELRKKYGTIWDNERRTR